MWNWDSFCTFLPFSLLKSNEVSRMEKSVWNGAICSLRIRRCLMRNNWPSISVWKKNFDYIFMSINIGEYGWGAIRWLCNAHETTPLTWAGIKNFNKSSTFLVNAARPWYVYFKALNVISTLSLHIWWNGGTHGGENEKIDRKLVDLNRKSSLKPLISFKHMCRCQRWGMLKEKSYTIM